MSTLTTLSENCRQLLLAFTVFSRRALGQPSYFSINLTDRCPIGCRHCYWRVQDRVQELSDEEIVEFFHRRREEGFVHATIVGGEPYVRPNLLAKITPIMPTNWLITSGIVPLRYLPNTTHFVSVDGADAETHNSIRGSIGLYQRIVKHLYRAHYEWNLPVYIHTVLNAKNYAQIQEIADVWIENGLADGIIFSTTTPIRGAEDDSLRLTYRQRVEIVNELLRAKQEFGSFIVNTREMFAYFLPKVSDVFSPRTCATARFVASFDAAGKRIPQCILSERADCTQCGCVITSILDILYRFPPTKGTLEAAAVFGRLRKTEGGK